RDRDGRRAAGSIGPRADAAHPTCPLKYRVRCSSPASAFRDLQTARGRAPHSWGRAGGAMRVLRSPDQFVDRPEIPGRIESTRDLLLGEVAAHLWIVSHDVRKRSPAFYRLLAAASH